MSDTLLTAFDLAGKTISMISHLLFEQWICSLTTADAVKIVSNADILAMFCTHMLPKVSLWTSMSGVTCNGSVPVKPFH